MYDFYSTTKHYSMISRHHSHEKDSSKQCSAHNQTTPVFITLHHYYSSMPVPLALLVLGGATYAAHRTGVLHKVARQVSYATAAYAKTEPAPANMTWEQQQQSLQMFPYRQHEGGFSNPMVRKEAMLMLGFDPNSNVQPEYKEVVKRHRFLMTRFHADVGGSDVICQKLNQARDTILPPK